MRILQGCSATAATLEVLGPSPVLNLDPGSWVSGFRGPWFRGQTPAEEKCLLIRLVKSPHFSFLLYYIAAVPQDGFALLLQGNKKNLFFCKIKPRADKQFFSQRDVDTWLPAETQCSSSNKLVLCVLPSVNILSYICDKIK